MTNGKTLASLCSKACCVAISAAVAGMMVPAAAFAHYDPINTSGKTLMWNGKSGATDPLGGGVEKVSASGNTVTYMGYAHSDGSHYTMYSLYTDITYDKSGVITNVNLHSGNDTFSGAWGYLIGKGGGTVEGYLPDGMSFAYATSTDASGNTVYKPTLSGTANYNNNYSISAVSLMQVTASEQLSSTPVASGRGSSGWDGTDPDGKYGGTWDGATINGTEITVTDASKVNLIRVTYTVGSENIKFNTYITLDTAAESYVDVVGDTTWMEYGDVLAELNSEGYSGTGSTNRNRWTTVMASVMLRQITSWGKTIGMSDSQVASSGEVADLDTVSGATKTSEPFVAALNQAVKDGYVKGVAEDVTITVDKGTSYEYCANDNSQDQSSVSVNDAGNYVLNSYFPVTDSIGRNGTHGITLDQIDVYSISGDVSNQDVLDLAKGNSNYAALATYTPESLKLNAKTSTGRDGKETTSYSWAPSTDTTGGTYYTDIDDDNIKFEYENSTQPLVVTAKSAKVTHVKFTYTLGHGNISLVYDLAEMKAAVDVQAAIEALGSNPSAAAVKAVRAQYDALSSDVHAFVPGISKLVAAEAKIAASAKSVTKSGVTYTVSGKVAQVSKVAASAKSATVLKTVKIGSKTYKVSKIKASVFKGTKVKTVTIKSTTLTKASVKNSLKGSKVTTVKVPASKKAAYKKAFAKANSGKKVTVK